MKNRCIALSILLACTNQALFAAGAHATQIMYIRTAAGANHLISYDPTDTVLTIKEKLVNKIDMPIDRQQLILNGKTLDDRTVVSSIEGLNNATTVFVTLKQTSTPPGGPAHVPAPAAAAAARPKTDAERIAYLENIIKEKDATIARLQNQLKEQEALVNSLLSR